MLAASTVSAIARSRFMAHLPMMPSLPLDVGGLDDRPPLVGFRLLKGAERLRRLLLARRRIDSEVGEALARLLVRQCLKHRRVESRDNVLRSVLRRPQPVPQ